MAIFTVGTNAGAAPSATIDEVIFQVAAPRNSGTGGYNTFLAIQANDGTEQGFNTNGTPVSGGPAGTENEIGDSKTSVVRLNSIPVKVINGIEYFEIRLDLNETNGGTSRNVDLNQLKLFTGGLNDGDGGTIVDTVAELNNLDLRYDLDATGGGNTIHLFDGNSGSGTDDYSILIPVSKFAGADFANDYLYLFAQLGTVPGIYDADGGFEEFNLQTAGTVSGTKFNDLDSDGNVDPNEGPIGGVTIQLIFGDTDHDGVQDAGETDFVIRTTTTAADGTYSFFGVATGSYDIREVVPAGSTRTTAPFQTITVLEGQNTLAAPIGNHFPVPNVTIDKVFVNVTDGADAGNSTTVIDGAGDRANYTIAVLNNGETALTNVVVTDALADAGAVAVLAGNGFNVGDSTTTGTLGVLDIGETWQYTATQTATQADLDTNGGTNDGDKDNSASVTATQQGTANTVMASDSAAAPILQAPSLNILKSVSSISGGVGMNGLTGADGAGDTINYAITVQNTGNVTLTGVTVTDPDADPGSIVFVSGDTNMDGELDVGETWTYSAAQTVTQADLDTNGGGDGDVDNVATADSDQTGPDTDDASAPVLPAPSLNIVKSVSSITGGVGMNGLTGADGAGDTINYAITVQNTGNVTLTGVTVTDPDADPGSIVFVSGDTNMDGELDVGETWTYSAAQTVTQADLDTNGGGDGDVDNVATADSDQTGPDTDDAAAPVLPAPSLNIVKSVSSITGGVGMNGLTGADGAGDTINYAITVQNTGNVTLTGVTVTDPDADPGSIVFVSGDTNMDGELDVGETWTYSAAQTVTQADLDTNGGGDGDVDNVATADSDQTGPDTDDASAPVLPAPSLNIVKSVSSITGGVGMNGLTGADSAGDTINYAITVQNTGNVTLTGVTVTDPDADPGSIVFVSGDTNMDGELDVGETWTYSAAQTVTQADLDTNGGGDGDVDNVATADSNQTGPDTDDASAPVLPAPSLNIVKSVSSITGGVGMNGLTGADGAGDTINYAITVQNTGNVTLTGVTVTDPDADPGSIVFVSGDTNMDGELDVGETWTYSAAQTVTQADLDTNGGGDGDVDNVATADSDQTGPDTDDASAPVLPAPSLNIVKSVSSITGGVGMNGLTGADGAGDTINYAITVQNTGNVTLTGVTVTDPDADPGSIVFVSGDTNMDGELDVGETWTYSAAQTVTQADLDTNGGGDGDVDNVATADSDQTGPDTDDASAPVLPAPSLNIVKSVSSITGGVGMNGLTGADSAGDTINYAITVQNTGNVTLTGVTVTDPDADPGSIVFVSGDTNMDGELDVGETWTYSAAQTVTQADLDSNGGGDGDVDNVATADSDQTGPDTDDAAAPVLRQPSIDLEKLVSVTGAMGSFVDADLDPMGTFGTLGPQNVNVNAPVFFKVVVDNTGNTTLEGLTITDLNTSNMGNTTLTLFANGALTAAAVAAGATLDGDDNMDGKLQVDETWTISYMQGFDPGQHVNTATVTTSEMGVTDSDAAYYYSLVNDGPGVRTPGFWQNPRNGGLFWDNIVGNEEKAGTTGFADGELVYAVDSNGDGFINSVGGDGINDDKPVDSVGLLIGDLNMDGLTNNGEDTLFFNLSDAKLLINASNKQVDNSTIWMIGRDTVATWLNYLAGNNIDPVGNALDPANSPAAWLNDAVDWLQQFGDKPNGTGRDGVFDFGSQNQTTKSPSWQNGGTDYEGDSYRSGSSIHNALGSYNENGTINGVIYAADSDDVLAMMALSVLP